MKKYFSAAFWDYAGERAIKSALQALVAGGLIGVGLFDIDWGEIVSLSGGYVILSLATSVLAYSKPGAVDAVVEPVPEEPWVQASLPKHAGDVIE